MDFKKSIKRSLTLVIIFASLFVHARPLETDDLIKIAFEHDYKSQILQSRDLSRDGSLALYVVCGKSNENLSGVIWRFNHNMR